MSKDQLKNNTIYPASLIIDTFRCAETALQFHVSGSAALKRETALDLEIDWMTSNFLGLGVIRRDGISMDNSDYFRCNFPDEDSAEELLRHLGERPTIKWRPHRDGTVTVWVHIDHFFQVVRADRTSVHNRRWLLFTFQCGSIAAYSSSKRLSPSRT